MSARCLEVVRKSERPGPACESLFSWERMATPACGGCSARCWRPEPPAPVGRKAAPSSPPAQLRGGRMLTPQSWPLCRWSREIGVSANAPGVDEDQGKPERLGAGLFPSGTGGRGASAAPCGGTAVADTAATGGFFLALGPRVWLGSKSPVPSPECFGWAHGAAGDLAGGGPGIRHGPGF